MTENQKKESKSANGINPLVAGIAGVVAGGVAAAAAFVLSDKKNQKKVKAAFDGVKDTVKEYIDTVQSHPVVEKGAETLETVVKETKKKIENKT